MNYSERPKLTFGKNILSSIHINFLFGAGVNGTVLPQLNERKKFKIISTHILTLLTDRTIT